MLKETSTIQLAGVLNLLPCKTYNMQKAIVPASFLSVAFSKGINLLNSEENMFIIREDTQQRTGSNLYKLFFANSKKITETITNDLNPAEPDYFSSYE